MATDIRTSELKSPIDVAEYLFRRLYEVGVRGVHGVPGDFNLVRYRSQPNIQKLTPIGSSRLHPQSWTQLGRELQ